MGDSRAGSAAATLKEMRRTDSRKVYILPTRYGLVYAGAVLLTLLVSINYNNGLGHLFTFLLAGIGVVAMHYTQRNLIGLGFSVQAGRPVFAGDHADATVTLRDQMHRERRALWLRGPADEARVDIPADGSARAAIRFVADQRGQRPLPAVRLVSIFPLGLFCTWTRPLPTAARQLVYPRPAPPTPLPRGDAGNGLQANRGARTGEDDFRGLRDHRRGDPSSRVHWRGSARGTGLKTKEFAGEGAGELNLTWARARGEDDEGRLAILCRWVLDADLAGLRYALELPGERIEAGAGPAHRHRCLRALALWRAP